MEARNKHLEIQLSRRMAGAAGTGTGGTTTGAAPGFKPRTARDLIDIYLQMKDTDPAAADAWYRRQLGVPSVDEGQDAAGAGVPGAAPAAMPSPAPQYGGPSAAAMPSPAANYGGPAPATMPLPAEVARMASRGPTTLPSSVAEAIAPQPSRVAQAVAGDDAALRQATSHDPRAAGILDEASAGGDGKPMTRDLAQGIYREAGGDPDRAAALARERGYDPSRLAESEGGGGGGGGGRRTINMITRQR